MMRESIGNSSISDEALAAYFDGEATEADAKAIREAIEGDPDLVAELEQLGVMQELTEASLQAVAAEVPQARFEQIWDQIDSAIEADTSVAAPVETPANLWERLKAAFAPVKWPLAAAGAAAVITVLAVGPDDSTEADGTDPIAKGETNKAPATPSVSPAQDGVPTPDTPPSHSPTPMNPDSRLAHGPSATEAVHPLAPLPDDSMVELHEIDGAGNDVRISNSGTVTVLYVEEDAQDQGSERSL